MRKNKRQYPRNKTSIPDDPDYVRALAKVRAVEVRNAPPRRLERPQNLERLNYTMPDGLPPLIAPLRPMMKRWNWRNEQTADGTLTDYEPLDEAGEQDDARLID